MRIEFTEADLHPDENGAFWLTLKVEDPITARRFVAAKKDKKYVADVKEWREKKSQDANAYMWHLLGKLAAKLSTPDVPVSPEDVYRAAIRDVGDNYEVTPIRDKALERWKVIWQANGLGWLCEEIGPSKLEGFTNVRNFYGSSTYDRAQMSRLISIIVQECKEQGVETLSERELSLLTEEWK